MSLAQCMSYGVKQFRSF